MEQSKITELDSLYAAYRLEFEESFTVYIPKTGFANYKFEEDGIYVQEVFVTPSMRGLKLAAKLTNMCLEDAIQRCDKYNKSQILNKIYTTVAVDGAETINSSMKAILNYGFKLLKSNSELIYFYKEISNE